MTDEREVAGEKVLAKLAAEADRQDWEAVLQAFQTVDAVVKHPSGYFSQSASELLARVAARAVEAGRLEDWTQKLLSVAAIGWTKTEAERSADGETSWRRELDWAQKLGLPGDVVRMGTPAIASGYLAHSARRPSSPYFFSRLLAYRTTI
ncbi:hypothetical protein [Cystobacter ferrugineus]|nr:hypothetical protein [Cystobacter ferrugineus]